MTRRIFIGTVSACARCALIIDTPTVGAVTK
jgi:hypothetical protein